MLPQPRRQPNSGSFTAGPAPSISIAYNPVSQTKDKQNKYLYRLDRAFRAGTPNLRLALLVVMPGEHNGQNICAPYFIRLNSRAALRYVHKRVDALMRELDGIIVIEDPPRPKPDSSK